MVWETLSIEEKLKDRLVSLGTKGEEFFSHYVSARKALLENILPEIKGQVPDITDHGADHIADVLNIVETCLGEEIEALTPIELYILCVSVLFHDVGNLYGRKQHNQNISKIYDFVRHKDITFQNEKKAVIQIAGAHTGCAKDGTKDTLRDVGNDMPVYKEPVRAQKIAAILRFADELAEGLQRTSVFMQNHHNYSNESMIYHRYASITEHCIDKHGGRIAVTYNIDVEKSGSNLVYKEIELSELLSFSYHRIIKLDQERKYAKHYCDWLSKFKEVSVNFDFWYEGDLLTLDLSPLVITDLIVPGDSTKKIEEINHKYEMEEVLSGILKSIGE